MLGKPSRRTREHLNENGRVAQAEVLEIADSGPTFDRTGPERKWWRPDNAIPEWMRPGQQVHEIALKTRLRVRPEGEPEFDVETTIRFPQRYEPKVGDEIEVVYDPEDHDELMLGRYEPHDASRVATGAISGPGMTTGATYAEGVDPNARMLELATQLQKGEITMAQFEEEQRKLFGG